MIVILFHPVRCHPNRMLMYHICQTTNLCVFVIAIKYESKSIWLLIPYTSDVHIYKAFILEDVQQNFCGRYCLFLINNI